MRITRRDAVVKAAIAGVIIAAFFVIRRGLVVAFLGIKILGHAGPLDAWEGAVRHETVERAGIPVDIYTSRHSYSPLLIVHGVNPTGKDSQDLIRISDALAQAGYQVFVPDFVEMRKQHLQPEEAEHIKSVFQTIGKDAAIACFSYGCGPAMIATADPEIRSHVRFALAFGGYFDIREALEFLITNPQSDIVYWKWVFLGGNSDLVAGEANQSQLRLIAERRAKGEASVIPENLSSDAKVLVDMFSAANAQSFWTLLKAGPENLHRRLDALSPSRFARQIQAPLILVHGINDSVIPAQQTIEFAEAARANGVKCSVTLLRMYGHMNPVLPQVGIGSIFGFYLPEAVRYFEVMNDLVERM